MLDNVSAMRCSSSTTKIFFAIKFAADQGERLYRNPQYMTAGHLSNHGARWQHIPRDRPQTVKTQEDDYERTHQSDRAKDGDRRRQGPPSRRNRNFVLEA